MHRSGSRSLYDHIKKKFTMARPFRCLDCGWRGWRLPLQSVSALEPPDECVDLTAIDQVLERRPSIVEPVFGQRDLG